MLSTADRLEILDVVARADDFATARDVQGYLGLTTEDMLLDGGEGTHRGRTALPDALAHIWSAEAPGTRHVSVGVTVTDVDEGADGVPNALTHATLLLVTTAPPALRTVVGVTQRLRKVDGTWLIARRTVVADAGAGA